jgi:hypothetical protein
MKSRQFKQNGFKGFFVLEAAIALVFATILLLSLNFNSNLNFSEFQLFRTANNVAEIFVKSEDNLKNLVSASKGDMLGSKNTKEKLELIGSAFPQYCVGIKANQFSAFSDGLCESKAGDSNFKVSASRTIFDGEDFFEADFIVYLD